MSRAVPPAWAVRLLRRTLPDGGWGRTVLADLEQEFREMAQARGTGAARRWYVREAVKLAARYAWKDVRPTGGGGGMTETIRRNVRLALRRLRRAPGFALVAVLTMALGIGATVAIFSVVRTVLLDPLPYEDAEELVVIWEWNTVRDNRENVANPGNFRVWRDRTRAFEAMSAVSLAQPTTLTVAGDAGEAVTQYAHPDFFSVLGLAPALGRAFPDDPAEMEGNEALLSARYWRERFGGDPGVVGRGVQVNGQPVTVVGVLPPDYVFQGEGTDVWVGTDVTRGDQTNSGRWLIPVGRLAEGATLEGARAELETVAASLREEFPEFNAGWSVNPVPLKESVVGDVRGGLWILLGAVGLLLLIACANVAALFLVRATERQREMAVRTSLGASGRTLAGQLLTESLVVAGAGAAVGVGLAHVGTRVLATRVPDAFALPRVEGAGVDGGVLLFAAGLTVLTGLLFGLAPALQAGNASPGATLGAEARGSSRRTGVLRNGLVVAEVALSVLLLSGAALFGRSLSTLLAVDPGIDPEHVLVARVNLAGEAYADGESRAAFFREAVRRLEEDPAVEAAGGNTFLPLEGWGAATSYWPGDRPPPPDEAKAAADIRNVVGDYFDAMGIRLLQGRTFDGRDGAEAPRRVVVNRTLARTHWPGESAVGKPLVVNWDAPEPWEIVGVVEDVRLSGLDQGPRAVVYVPYDQAQWFPFVHLAVRGRGETGSLDALLRETVGGMDRGVPVGEVREMGAVVAGSVARSRLTAVLMGVFAALATLLAVVGLYGVLAYTVSRRAREMGVRAALGARPGAIRGMVVRQGLGLVGLGVALGLGAALLGGRVLEGLLFQVEPDDPGALAAAAALLLAVGVAACLAPAWKASRVDPARALRAE